MHKLSFAGQRENYSLPSFKFPWLCALFVYCTTAVLIVINFLFVVGILGKCRYIYYGKHSEGNRFIRDDQL